MAHGRLMPAQFEEFLSLELVPYQMYAPLDFLLAYLGNPLKGRKGLGHEGRKSCRNLKPRAAAPGRIAHFEAGFGDGGKVVVGFCGQADHKVELYLPPAVLKQFLGVQQQFFFGYALVDDITQALAACLRSEGAAGAAQVGHPFDDFIINGADAQ